jgi:predicted ATPase
VLNGIRLAVHGGRINPDNVKLHYFERRRIDERVEHFVRSPVIDQDGRINAWPEGFFDEWDKSLEALMEPRGAYPWALI